MSAGRFVSLFSGAGGLDVGAMKAGLLPAIATDIDKDCIATLDRQFGHSDSDLWTGDIHELLDSSMLAFYRSIRVVIGGPPCQGFSVAGKMDPDDPRSQLVFRFLDAVFQVRPDGFVMENVPALANKSWSLVMERLRTRAKHAGYETEVHVLDAADYGVGQRRKRMFLFGYRHGGHVKLEEPSSYRTPASSVIGPDVLTYKHADIQPGARVTFARKPILRKSAYAGLLTNGGGRIFDVREPSPTLPATMGANRTPIYDVRQLTSGGPSWVEEYHARLMAGFPPLTEVPPDVALKRLSMREAAALQGFHPQYLFVGKPASIWRQVGNAVPPKLAEVAVRGLLQAIS